MDDYYTLLGVSKSATDEEIKKAYRKLAQEHHPDRATGNEKKFKEINEAYQVLSSRERRQQYDRFSAGGGSAFGGGRYGQQAGGFGGFETHFDASDLGDFGDIFESFFGAGGRRRKTYTHGSDLQIIQEITLEEAYTGAKKELKFKASSSCADCAGLGHFASEGTKQCTACNGRGEIKEVRNTFFGSFQQVRACAKCAGVGEIPNKVCGTCKGTGRLVTPRSLSVEIFAGVVSGQLIKLSGAGEAGERGAPAGDLYVQVRVAPHSKFERHDSDLVVKKEINIFDVLRGKKIEISLISGEATAIEIPHGYNLSEPFKISGKGMPKFGSRGYGNLFVEFEVKTPKKISSKARRILEDLDGEIG